MTDVETGTIGILSVGSGDTKLTFDKSDPAELIRSARIVTDMLRRGYALLIEVDGRYQRVYEFREDTAEYVIADGPTIAATETLPDERDPPPEQAAAESGGAPAPEASAPRRRGRPTKTVPASSTRGIAVARSAGG